MERRIKAGRFISEFYKLNVAATTLDKVKTFYTKMLK
jgi:hypothetical protein